MSHLRPFWLTGRPRFHVMLHNAKITALGKKFVITKNIPEKISENFCLNITRM